MVTSPTCQVTLRSTTSVRSGKPAPKELIGPLSAPASTRSGPVKRLHVCTLVLVAAVSSLATLTCWLWSWTRKKVQEAQKVQAQEEAQ